MLAERWNLNCESPSTRSLQRQIVKMAGPIGQRWQLCSTRWRTPSAPSSRGFRLFLRRRTLIDGNSTACTQQPSQSAVWIRMPVYSISTQPAEELSCPVSHQAHPRSPPMPQGSNPPSRCGDETSGGRSELERCPASGPCSRMPDQRTGGSAPSAASLIWEIRTIPSRPMGAVTCGADGSMSVYVYQLSRARRNT